MLCVDGLTKRFGDRAVLRNVTFRVEAGEVYGLVGANGAGKTTAVSIIAGTLAPDGGEVAVGDLRSARARRAKIGIATQEIALYPSLTCEEHLTFFGRLYGLRGAALSRRLERLIELMGLGEYRHAQVDTLSGGWRRRLNLAVALVHAPAFLLLDEPSAGLDVEARQSVWRLIEGLRVEGVAVLLTTHLLDEAEALCDRIAIMVEGRIAASGTLSQLRSLVPAREVAVVEGADTGRIHERARALGIRVRDYGGRPTLLLPEKSTVTSLVERLGEVGVRSISLQPVSLLHVYLEITGGDRHANLPNSV